MAVNGDEMRPEETDDGIHDPNSYFEAFAGIVAALDSLAKAVTPDEDDDGTPPNEMPASCCNSYFASFKAIQGALVRVREATEERLAELAEKDPNFAAWKDAYSIAVGKGANTISNGIAIGWNSTAASGTGTAGKDSGAVAVGKAASAVGIDAVAIGRGAAAGASSARTTKATVQLGRGTNTNDGTLQFRDWQLVGADGKIPTGRLPADAGGIVEATGAFGAADDRTTGLWYAVFTLEGLGIADESVCLSGLSLVCSSGATLPSGDTRRLEIRSEDGSVLLAASENSATFDAAGGTVPFRFATPAMLEAGTRYRLKLADASGANASAPVTLASTDGAGGYLASCINGTASLRTDFFPCVSFTVLKPAPDIASVLADARDAVLGAGAFDFAAPEADGGVLRLQNRAVNAVSLDGAPVSLAFPGATEGRGRAFVVRLTCSAATEWTLPADVSFESDDEDVFAAIEAGDTAVFIFSEIAENKFMVSRKTVMAVAKE